MNIQELQEQRALGEAVARLRANKDFQEVLMKGYCSDEVRRVMTQMRLSDEAGLALLAQRLKAVALFEGYLEMLEYTAAEAHALLTGEPS